jgi:hypothetical protein
MSGAAGRATAGGWEFTARPEGIRLGQIRYDVGAWERTATSLTSIAAPSSAAPTSGDAYDGVAMNSYGVKDCGRVASPPSPLP